MNARTEEPARTGRWARLCAASIAGALLLVPAPSLDAAKVQKRYYAHTAVHDRYGVIAPWYTGQNGQSTSASASPPRRSSATRGPTPQTAAAAAPHYVFNGHWKIAPDGAITPVPINDWDNGDLGQRAAYVLSGLVDYYRYSRRPGGDRPHHLSGRRPAGPLPHARRPPLAQLPHQRADQGQALRQVRSRRG